MPALRCTFKERRKANTVHTVVAATKKGKYATNKMGGVFVHNIWDICNSSEFGRNQRKYNSLFSFIALGAEDMQRRTWTNPSPPSMLTMHGKAYHRIFDLQQQYSDITVVNTARFYIYNSEFNTPSRALHINHNTASSLRIVLHIPNKIYHGLGGTKVLLTRCYVTLVLPLILRVVYIFLYSLLFCGDFGEVSSCVRMFMSPHPRF